MSRDTTTGGKFQHTLYVSMVLSNTYQEIEKEVTLPERQRNGRKHRIDILADKKHLFSCKTQNVNGTNEEKLPFEAMKMQDALDDGDYETATIVLDGEGWSLKKYYLTSQDFKNKMKRMAPNVRLVCSKDILKELQSKKGSQ